MLLVRLVRMHALPQNRSHMQARDSQLAMPHLQLLKLLPHAEVRCADRGLLHIQRCQQLLQCPTHTTSDGQPRDR